MTIFSRLFFFNKFYFLNFLNRLNKNVFFCNGFFIIWMFHKMFINQVHYNSWSLKQNGDKQSLHKKKFIEQHFPEIQEIESLKNKWWKFPRIWTCLLILQLHLHNFGQIGGGGTRWKSGQLVFLPRRNQPQQFSTDSFFFFFKEIMIMYWQERGKKWNCLHCKQDKVKHSSWKQSEKMSDKTNNKRVILILKYCLVNKEKTKQNKTCQWGVIFGEWKLFMKNLFQEITKLV